MDYSIRIGGQAGQGLQTIGTVLSKLFARQGYHVFSHQDFMSRIRGGHNFNQIRFSDRPVGCSRPRVDILIALDRNTVDVHRGDLNPGGLAVYDSEAIKEKIDGPELLDVPFRRIAMETAGSRLMENTVAVGAVMGMLGMDTGPLETLLSDTFLRKGQDIVDQNIAAARAGHTHAGANCPSCSFQIPVNEKAERLMLMDGTAGMGMGALLSGCRFYAAYPMTPSTGLLTFMAEANKNHSLVMEQAEDEIAALQMALGASFAGVRAMTGTAGGGFALMVEGLSLAGMTETPVVIYVGGRPAPATGLPTRTEQADLLFLLHAAHGEFPRVILAPGDPEQAFYLTNKAFDLAEKYQVPAFIYGDQHLADSERTLTALDPSRLVYHDYRLRAADLEGLKEYQRHAFTGTGVSPLAEPGASRHLVVTDSDEHDEEGHIIEDAETRVRMVDKRLLKKLPLLREEIGPPLLYGNGEPEIVIAGFGSTLGVLREAVDVLSSHHNIALMHFSELWPFPDPGQHDYLDKLRRAGRTICVENNATSQLAQLVRGETGYQFTDRINKYDGRPFLLDSLVEDLEKIIG
jgi:2-oxoglutarate ferredoxin oxidoreductase subunit alpha